MTLAVGSSLALGAPIDAIAQVGMSQGALNPNLASRDELMALPGLTEAAADAVMRLGRT